MKIRFLCLSIFACSAIVLSNEFMHAPKVRRISLNSIKEQAADIFAEQLKCAAESVQILGSIQVLSQSKENGDIQSEIERLRISAVRLYRCRMHYVDLLVHEQLGINPFDQPMSGLALFGNLAETLGAVQQRIICYLYDIIEDKSRVFIKQHITGLPDVLKSIKLYSDDVKRVRDALVALEKKIHAVRSVNVKSGDKKNEHNCTKRA